MTFNDFKPADSVQAARDDAAFERDLDRTIEREVGTRTRRSVIPATALEARLRTLPGMCDDCGGKGLDVGALAEPEPCTVCLGGGVELAEEPERRRVEREARHDARRIA